MSAKLLLSFADRGCRVVNATVPHGRILGFRDRSNIYKQKKNSVALVRERTIPTERPPLIGEVSANFFADRGCRVVNATDLHGRILGFQDPSRYFFFKVAPQLYSRG
jgi:hypothetical protein